MNSAIAAKLNVLESAIVRVEEWAHVLFVVVKGLGSRFVSKKIMEKKMETVVVTKRVISDSLRDWAVGQLFDTQNKIFKTIEVDFQGYEYDDGQECEFAIYLVTGEYLRDLT